MSIPLEFAQKAATDFIKQFPTAAQLIDSQFEFAQRMLDIQREFAHRIMGVGAPKVKKDAPIPTSPKAAPLKAIAAPARKATAAKPGTAGRKKTPASAEQPGTAAT